MSGRLSEIAPARINIDSEPAWFKIKADVDSSMTTIMDSRLATLPGGKDGAAAMAVRKEVEARLAKVSRLLSALGGSESSMRIVVHRITG